MKNKAFLWALILTGTMILFAGCSRGDVAEHGVDSRSEVRRSVGENDLYEDESLFMEDMEEGAEHLWDETEHGIDNAQQKAEEGIEDIMDGAHENSEIMAQSDTTDQ